MAKWNQEVKDKAAKAKKQEEDSPEEEAQDKAAKAKSKKNTSQQDSPSSCHVDVEATDDVDACSRTVSTQTPCCIRRVQPARDEKDSFCFFLNCVDQPLCLQDLKRTGRSSMKHHSLSLSDAFNNVFPCMLRARTGPRRIWRQ